MTARRLVIDPVTRIEGHLRVEAQVAGGKVTDAWSSGTMWRGIEIVVRGRDPREAWLFAQRICGVCTTVHALASVRAVEDALGITPPVNAEYLRQLIALSQYVHDHVVHFYHLQAFDWVDVTSALKADPVKTAALQASLSSYPRGSAGDFAQVKAKLGKFMATGDMGPFTDGYWGHPAYRLPPEVNLLAVSHYIDALTFQRSFIRIHALLGGKNPHPQSYLVGGMARPIDLNSDDAVNDGVLQELRLLLQDGLAFVTQAYVPDLLAIASYYPDWFRLGAGAGNYLSFGEFSATGQPPRGGGPGRTDLLFPPGIILGRDLSAVHPVDPVKITEEVARSWYTYTTGDDKALRPSDGQTIPNYTGPDPPYQLLDVDGRYSWLKAPRYDGHVMEVGPLARMLVAWAGGRPRPRELLGDALRQLRLGPDALMSSMGRIVARGIETQLAAEHALTVLEALRHNIASGDTQVFDNTRWDPSTWPERARGFGMHGAPRGALSHWVEITGGKVASYQAVVPTTWNASPRDAAGQRGPYEASLIGTPVAQQDRPLEILRTLHSFDPCMACAAHILDEDGTELLKVQVT
jgi:Ni,Fe-hydrogenase I large subunit